MGIINRTKGVQTTDGANVKLVRVLGNNTVKEYDPFLMLDSFDSTNYEDYKNGFPTHPHRGIETITYISQGHITHKDSMGNEKTVGDRSIQWMTAGSGVYHSEMFQPEPRLLGLQTWLNMKRKDKMAKPDYHEITPDDIETIETDDYILDIYCGEYDGKRGFQSQYQPLDYYVLRMKKGKELTLNTKDNYSVILFTLLGDATIDGELVEEKTAIRFEGEKVTIQAMDDIELVWMASPRIDEEIAWGGPIVMNEPREIQKAFLEMREGTFIKDDLEI